MSDSSDDGQVRLHEAYMKHRHKLNKGREENYRAFDKQVVALASGAIALSLVFVHKIAPSPSANTKWLLWGSWICFLGSILLTLLSFILGKIAYDNEINRWDKYYSLLKDYYDSRKENTYAKAESILQTRARFSNATAVLKYVALGLLCLGAASLCCFAGFNL